MKRSKAAGPIQDIAKNLDYSLRVNGSKNVVVLSGRPREGKSAFLANCLPVLCDLYQRKVLVVDFQPERDDYLERSLTPVGKNKKNVRQTSVRGLDYVHCNDLGLADFFDDTKMSRTIKTHLNDISLGYDFVFMNVKTTERSALPGLPMDGVVVVRSRKSLGKGKCRLTEEIIDREIPVLGIVFNEGV